MAPLVTHSGARFTYYDFVSHYFELVGWTILFYDHALQLGREVNLVWKQKFTLATVLYIAARYFLFIAYVTPILVSINPHIMAPESSRQTFIAKFAESMDILSQTAVTVIMTLRTYAIYNRSRKILALLSILGSMIPALGIWICATIEAGSHTQQSNTAIPFMLLSLFTLVFDTTSVFLTVWKTLEDRRWHRLPQKGVLTLILRDGSVYFCAMSSAHLFSILTYWVAPPGICGIGIPPSRSMSVVLVCRFMLNLREQCYHSQDASVSTDWMYHMAFAAPSMQSVPESPLEDGYPHLPRFVFEVSVSKPAQ